MVRKPKKRAALRTSHKRLNKEAELLNKLKLTLLALVGTILIVVLSLSFFGPKIGSFFLLLSKNRNNTGPGDIIPPTSPIFSQVPQAVNEKKVSLNGITEPGAKVRIFVNGPEKGVTTADNDGSFTFVDIELGLGNNIMFAKATDENNNESEKSRIYAILFDDEAPEIVITSPNNGEEVKNLNKRVLIQGTLDEVASVKINGRQAVVKPDNAFELLLGVNEGDITITVEAIDKADNKTTETIYIKYKKG